MISYVRVEKASKTLLIQNRKSRMSCCRHLAVASVVPRHAPPFSRVQHYFLMALALISICAVYRAREMGHVKVGERRRGRWTWVECKRPFMFSTTGRTFPTSTDARAIVFHLIINNKAYTSYRHQNSKQSQVVSGLRGPRSVSPHGKPVKVWWTHGSYR